mmetsp:Transcript_9708/g.13552  ORF Transcript_9708/g.13552 Transcript_9708/m.13552 type:complete len:82 (+) Transcript_9708:297-542(+)
MILRCCGQTAVYPALAYESRRVPLSSDKLLQIVMDPIKTLLHTKHLRSWYDSKIVAFLFAVAAEVPEAMRAPEPFAFRDWL